MINKERMGEKKLGNSERKKGTPQAGNGVMTTDGRDTSKSESPNPQTNELLDSPGQVIKY